MVKQDGENGTGRLERKDMVFSFAFFFVLSHQFHGEAIVVLFSLLPALISDWSFICFSTYKKI